MKKKARVPKTDISAQRKNSHLEICLTEPVEYGSFDGNGFGSYRLDHDAVPELDKNKIDLTCQVLGKTLDAPLIIGAMTGGTPRAAKINRRLSLAAEKCGVGFALGSQRKMLESKDAITSFAVRKHAPKLKLLIGNLGAVQLNYGVTVEDVKFLISEVGCDAFNFHLNCLQEAIQPEGETDFSGLLTKMKNVISQIDVPVLAKEVGAGISEKTAQKLKALGLAGIETAGLGGTSWSKIESLRTTDKNRRSVGELFARWGIPTAESIVVCRQNFPNGVVIASGGIRNGIEVAKSIALGADACALALPVLKAAEKSVESAVALIERIKEELLTAMFVTGSATLTDLRRATIKRAVDFTSLP